MDNINTIVQGILYQPSLMTAHAEQRAEEAKGRYQDNLAGILLDHVGG